jgi:nitroreductase
MELQRAMEARRMVRSFSGDPVRREVLEELLSLAIRAPSAGNTAGREFIVLEGSETKRYWDATTTPTWRETSRRWPGLSKAPVAVVVLVSPDSYLQRYGEPDKAHSGLGPESGEVAWPVPYWYFDAGASVMALLLGATDAGLGACFLGNFRGETELLHALGVDHPWRFAGTVLIGEPGGNDPVSASVSLGRPPTSRLVHYGAWSSRSDGPTQPPSR